MEYPNSSPAPSVSSVALRFGFLAGLANVALSLVLFLTHTDQSPIRWVGLLISIGAIYLAHTEFKKQNGGFMEYGQGLGIGTLLSLIAGLMSAVFIFVYVSYIDTNYLTHLMDVTRTQMEGRGNMTDEQIDQAMDMSAKFMTPTAMVIFSVIGGAFFGFILSLIISAITKNSQPEFE